MNLFMVLYTLKCKNTLHLSKAAFIRTNDLNDRRGLTKAVEDFCNVAVFPDAQKGLRAFLEKRKSNWKL